MLVFDRYPLVDGTFFLSPKQYNKNAVEVNIIFVIKFSMVFFFALSNSENAEQFLFVVNYLLDYNVDYDV